MVLQPGDRFVCSDEAAAITGSTPNTLSYRRQLRLPPKFYKQGRSVRYLVSDLVRWAGQNPVEPEPQGVSRSLMSRRNRISA